MIDFQKLKTIIENNNSFLLTTHVNPDADAIGSEIALYYILLELGKHVRIINHSPTPYNLLFLDEVYKIEQYHPEQHAGAFEEADVLVALDFNRSDRIVKMKEGFNNSSKLKICIDHHQEPEDFVHHLFVDTYYSATGQIIYDFIKQTGIVELSYRTAVPIYAAIMTDTGSFRYERTTPEIHRIAAELLETGIIPNDIFDAIYDQSRFSKVKLLGKALESMKRTGNGSQISYMVLTQKDFMELDAEESDTDGFVSFSLSVEKVKLGMLFIELRDGFKVSFRSKGMIAVNKLAGEFGGGGHLNASGARIHNGSLTEYLPEIIKRAESYLI